MGVLDKLKNKSPEYRQRVAGLSAIVVTVLILGFWLIDLGARFNQAEAEVEENTISPFETLKDSFGYFFGEAKSAIDKGVSVFDEQPEITIQEEGDLQIQENEDGSMQDNDETEFSTAPELPENIDEIDQYFEVVNEEGENTETLEETE